VCAEADAANAGTRTRRQFWLPLIPPLTRKLLFLILLGNAHITSQSGTKIG
jgi:hypothetical protein